MCIVKELVSMHSSMKTCCEKEENDNEWKRPEKVQGERVAGNKSKHEKEKGN